MNSHRDDFLETSEERYARAFREHIRYLNDNQFKGKLSPAAETIRCDAWSNDCGEGAPGYSHLRDLAGTHGNVYFFPLVHDALVRYAAAIQVKAPDTNEREKDLHDLIVGVCGFANMQENALGRTDKADRLNGQAVADYVIGNIQKQAKGATRTK